MERLRGPNVGGLLIGLVILGVGIYYFVEQTLGIAIPELDWDRVWPLFVIALGAGIVSSNWTKKDDGGDGPVS